MTPRLKFLRAGALALLLAHPAVPQSQHAAPPPDATVTAPSAYRLQFENEWVRVVRVHYGAREKVPPHAHTTWPAAYVYLNDSGPIIFRHKDWEHPELTRPAAKAGSFRLSPTTAVNEVHEAENPNDTPSDFLRVEFKTEPAERRSLTGRYPREAIAAGASLHRVQFENAQIRITRHVCAPRESFSLAARAGEPTLLVALSDVQLKAGRAASSITLAPGQTQWVSNRQAETFGNLNNQPAEMLQFDFKTAPLKVTVRAKQ